jgi:hypothetical protein
MRRVTIATMVAVTTIACVLAGSPWARSQSAPEVDRKEAERQRLERDARIARQVARAREGKSAVIKVDTLKLGTRELVRVMLEDVKGRRVALVPNFKDKDKKWSPPEELVKALRRVPPGYFEMIHTEVAYGVEWVVGVGADAPDSLKNLEKSIKGRRWTAEKPEKKSDEAAEQAAAVEGTATGRLIEMATRRIGGIEATCLIVERGVMMTRTEFYLVREGRRGKLEKAKRDILRAAADLAKGDRVEIRYLLKDKIHHVLSLRKVE